MGTVSFPGVNSGRGVTLTPHPFALEGVRGERHAPAAIYPRERPGTHCTVDWSRKSRAIPVLDLWAVRPVQSLSICTRVHLTLPFTEIYSVVGESHISDNRFFPLYRNVQKVYTAVSFLLISFIVRGGDHR